jgi:hypothetical protein
LAVRGSRRASILARLLTELDAHDLGATSPTWWVPDLEALARRHDFSLLARVLPDRGDRARLIEIARRGALVANVGLTTPSASADVALRAATLFNVAVALFDTLMESGAAAGVEVARVTTPQGLLGVALGSTECLPQASDPAAAGVAALFEAVMRTASSLLVASPAKARRAADLLHRMHTSETQPTASRHAAKVLPTAFIGLLANLDENPGLDALFHRLGEFLALVDDWHDLAGDLLTGNANRFLTDREGSPGGRLLGAARGLGRVALPARSERFIGDELVSAMSGTLRAAHRLGPAILGRTGALLSHFLGRP